MATKDFRIIFLDILTDDKTLRRQIERVEFSGRSYGSQIRDMAGLANGQIIECDASSVQFPALSDYQGLIIGGSINNPLEGEENPWMERTYDYIREAVNVGVPILGICGGLQFTARALGRRITYNPRGLNFGNSEVYLTKAGRADPLFKGLENHFSALVSHRCIVDSLADDWELLAYSLKSPFDAIKIGDRIRLLEFHPEFSAKTFRGLFELRKDKLFSEGVILRTEANQFISSIQDTSRVGRQILKNYIRYFVLPSVDRE